MFFGFPKNSVYANGEQLAVVSYDANNKPSGAMLLDGFIVTGLSISSECEDVTTIGQPFFRRVPVSQLVSLDIRSCGLCHYETGPAAERIEQELKSAWSLSVDELLKIVYRKMDARESISQG